MGMHDGGFRWSGRFAPLVIATTWAVLAAAGCERAPSGGATAGAATPPSGAASAPAVVAATVAPPALPSYWIETDYDSWIGKRWDELELFRFLNRPPRDVDAGTRYVVFYSRTCDHCEAMFNEDLAPNAELAANVTAIEIPADKDVLTSPDGWPMPETACELLNLPLGVNWIITSPLAVRLENGVVACAEEAEHKGCLELAD